MSNAIIDSGAGVSVMDLGTFERLGLKHEMITDLKEVLVDASGNEMDILGKIDVKINIQGSERVFEHDFRVLNQHSYRNVILGRDVLCRFNEVTFDFRNDEIIMDKCHIRKAPTAKCKTVRINKISVIPARTEQILVVKGNKGHAFATQDFSPSNALKYGNLYISKARVLPNEDGKFVVTAVNVGNEPIRIHKRQVIGHLNEPGEVVASINPMVEKKDDISLGTNLSNVQKKHVLELIKKYDDVFAKDPKNPSRNTLVNHDIITECQKPIYVKPRRIPMGWEKEVEIQVEEMLKNKIIRPSKSPWNSPIIMVKKRDQSLRFVSDFRSLNDVTKKDTYPLPQIKDVIDKMHGAQFWTTLDAASAYWSLPLTESSKEKTAFSVPNGKYEFEVTPYGLCNAGRSYQRMIDMCLADLPKERILAYIDDIVIFSRTFEEHLQDVESVLHKLREANVSLKLSKCVWAAAEVEYLGFVLSGDGIRPQKQLTEAILQYAVPKTKKEIKRFLGMSGFYREFIKDFANMAAPMNNLTKDSVNFEWTVECENSFKNLKRALMTAPVLAFPRTGTEFIVTVDASNTAVGGELSQYQPDGTIHPVAYFSNALKDAQKNWSPYAQEAFALVMATRHWDTYLRGNKFVIHSDHNPLVYLRNKKDPKGKMARWIAELENFDYDVTYIQGKLNCKADALSRNEGAIVNRLNEAKFEESIYTIESSRHFHDQLYKEQNDDPIIDAARKCIESNENVTEGQLKRINKQLRLVNGILTKSGRPIIPVSMRDYLITEYHRMGHFGVEKLYNLLQQRFYWPNMYRTVANYLSDCDICNQCKADVNPPMAPLIPIFVPLAPLELVCIDIAHLPETKRGFKYILLIGDVFSKCIEAVPMKNQLAETICDAMYRNWIMRFGCPYYILSDQGSNVDGETVRALCTEFNIEKRRTSAYHSQGNGFAERNIRTIRELFRTLLLDFGIPQNQWDTLIPSILFALNTTVSSTTKCAPFEVIYGRKPVLPLDTMFGLSSEVGDASTPSEYVSNLKIRLREILLKVSENTGIAQKKMMKQYNQKIVYHDYEPDDMVWLRKKNFRPGESRKLSPRRSGPWTILRKMPNAVNFEIFNPKSKERKVVHHNRLTPAQNSVNVLPTNSVWESHAKSQKRKATKPIQRTDDESSSSDSSSDEESDGVVTNTDQTENEERPRRYPLRNRVPRIIEGAVPWNAVTI